MRTTHKLNLTGMRALLLTGAILVLAGVVFTFAPMKPVAAARQALAARLNSSPTAGKILSVAPNAVREAVKKRLVAAAKSAPSVESAVAVNTAPAGAVNASAAGMNVSSSMMFDSTLDLLASPPDATPVARGQIITYVVTLTNDNAPDNIPADPLVLDLYIRSQVPANTTLVGGSIQILEQPHSPLPFFWSCAPVGGAVECRPGNNAFEAFKVFRFQYQVQVNNNAPFGTNVFNFANYIYDLQPPTPDEIITSNPTSHPVSAVADLVLNKSASVASVLAGGTSVPNINAAGGTGDITYDIFVSNAGPNDAVNVAMEDEMPNNTILVGGPTLIASTVAVNGVPQPAFSMPCNVFPAEANKIQCIPANNSALNPGWTSRVMPAGFNGIIRFRVRVPADAVPGQIVTNKARLVSRTFFDSNLTTIDPNSANNTQVPTQTQITTSADVNITKTTTNASPTAGGAAFGYTLTVNNAGASDAKNVVVTDPLPAGVVLANNNIGIAPANSGFSCTSPAVGQNGTITCSNPNMAAGATATITIVAQVVSNVASGVRTNTATVTSSTSDPNSNNNSDNVQQNIQVNAPLSITKVGPAAVCAGDTFTYKVTVNNGGSSTALNATISDPLPANTTFVSLSGTGAFANGCSHNGGTPGTVTCSAIDIPTGMHELNITVKLSPSAPAGNLANTATITSAGTGSIAVGNSTANATVSRCADLQITKDDSPDAVLAGQDINYTITVKNVGPSDIGAGEFTVTDTIPTGTVLKTGTTIIAPGFSCNGGVAFPCNATAPLPVGASVQIKFTVTVNANFNNGQPGGFVTNTASVNVTGGNIVDSNSQNNSSTTRTPIGPSADLSVQKQSFTLAGSAFDAQVTAGGAISAAPPSLPVPIVTGQGEIFYALTYRNNGQGDAVNVHIRDAIPANSQFVAGSIVVTPASGPALTCTVSPLPTELDCTPTGGGTLPAGANGTISFRTRVLANVPEATAIRNTATINSEGIGATPATPDPNGGNNSSTTQNRVRTEANLSIAKTGPASVNAGANITYQITVTNNGVSDAQNVVVKDTLPANVSYVSSSSTNNQFVCAPDNGNAGVINCTTATLIANDPNIIPPRSGSNTAIITIVGKVAANVANGTVLANNATVSATTSDPVQSNNSVGPINTTVTTDAAVAIIKTDNPDPVVAGTNLTYSITVSNTGPSNAVNANVVDTLPGGTTFLSAVGTGIFSAANACSHSAGVVTCNPLNGVIPVGANDNITITVRVNANTPANPLPHNPDNPAGLLNSVTVNWQDSNGVVGPLVANSATSTTRTTVRHESDMSLKKEAPDTVIAGGRMDYRLILSNKGPSDVLGDGTPGSIMIMDQLANGVSLANVANNLFVAPGGPGGFVCTYDANTRKVTCLNAAGAAGNFQVGANIEIIIKVQTDSNLPDGSNIINCAQVTLRNTDATPEIDPIGGGQHDNNNVVTVPASGNNEACDSTVVHTLADLGVAKTATAVIDPDGAGPLSPVALPVVGPNVPPGAVNAGGYIRFDVPFGNAGPSDAVNVRLTDVVPGNTAFVGALATGGVFVPATQPPANPFTFTIQAVDTIPPNGPNVNLECVVSGAAGSQQIQCTPKGNTGLGAPGPYADGVLPAGYQGTLTFFVKVNESVSGGTIVANGANITSAPNGSNPGTADPNPGNNTSLPTQTVVVASSNLTVSKIVQSAVTSASNPNQTGPIGPATPPNGVATTGTAVLPGTYMTYRITLTNNGPSDVSNIRLTDILPSGLETPPGRVLGVKYISVSPVPLPSGVTFVCAPPTGVNPQNNPQGNGGSVVCTAPLLSANAPNNTAAIDVTVFIDPATKANLIDTAIFDATINNFNRPVSGTATLTTPVAPTSDLALTKTHTNSAGVVGGPVTAGTSGNLYNVTVTNNGPSAAQMFNLVDTLPPFQKITNIQVGRLDGNGQFVTPNAKDGNGNPNVICTANPGVGSPGNTNSVTCTASELPPNKNPDGTVNPAGTFIVRLTFTQDQFTPQPTPTSYQNCVTATSMSTDPVPANNTNVCDTVPIIFRTDLTGTKTDSPDPVIAGTNLTYTITATTNGPSAAFNLMISDQLPTGTVFVSAVASPGATLITPAVNANGLVKATWDAPGGTPGGLTGVGVVRTLTIVVRVCPDFQQILNLTDAQMCVPNLTNTAIISSDTPNLVGGTPNQISVSQTTTVQAQSDLSIGKTGPAQAIYSTTQTPSNITYTITFSNAGPSNASGVMILDVLPKGFTVVGTPTSTVPGTTFLITTTNGVTSVKATLGVLGAANQCQLNRPTSGTITIVARVPIKHPTITVTNTATISTTNCLPDPNLANNTATWDTRIVPPQTTPGVAYPALSEVSDQKEGSILFYPIYTSDAVNNNTQNTRIAMTNTSATERVTVHLFAVDGSSCAVLDAFLCLTPNQTTSFLASDFDPGNTGYLVGVAVEDATGMPRVFNELIGDLYVKFSSGHQANLPAESIAASMMFPAGVDPNVTTTTLRFDGMNYNRLPRILAADNIGSRADGNSTMLIINRVGGNFTTTGATIGNLTGLLYDDAENAFSFTANLGVCQYRKILDNTFPRAFNQFERVIPAGRTGWMKFWTVNDWALFGAQINFNPNTASSANAFNQGHNLHHLTLTDAATIVVPVFIPSC